MSRAEELYLRARTHANRGSPTQARRLLQRAGQLSSSADLTARIDLTRAYLEAETAGQPTGVALGQALLERPGLSEETLGLVHSQLGLMWMRMGEGDRALEAFARALELLPPSGEYVGRVLLNRGNVHLQRGRVTQAVADFTGAHEHLVGDDVQVTRAKAGHNLGYARLLSGDLVGAVAGIDEAAQVLSAISPAYRATVEQDRAEILTAAGRPREAARALARAAEAYGSRRLRTSQAECELTLAWTLLREDPARARVVARRSARRFRGQASPVRAMRADAAALVAEISAGGTSPALLRRADALAAELRGHGHRQDATVLELQGARVAVRRGALAEARARLERVPTGGTLPVTTRLLVREVRAELARARGDGRRARHHVRAGLADLHTWQSSFGSLDLQSTLVGHGRALASQGLELAVEDGDPLLLLEWSERARALVGRVAPVHPPADPQVADDLTELRLLHGAGPERRTTAGRRAEELRDRVRRQQWHTEGPHAVTEPARAEELRVALGDDDAVLLAHVVVCERVVALALSPGDAAVLDLGPLAPLRDRLDGLASDLTMAAAHRDSPLAAPLRASLHDRLALVAQQLVAPLLPHLGDGRVVMTPSGALAGTPWSLLPGLRGRPLTIPPSATRWLDLRGAPAPRRVGLVAGPGVARGEEEVTRAAAAWPGSTVLCGDDAGTERVAALAAEVDLLHVAGHGRHTGENPLFSAVELLDGPWFGYDLDLLARTPSTVVLSACELGRVSVRSGEEAIGMSAAWLHAGARTVLSSPVLVADDVACETFARWHALVATGTAPADALARVVEAADDVVPVLSFGGGW